MELTFDKAIELLEITNISKIKIEDLPQLEKKLKKRWHPDRVAHLNDAVITAEYTTKFQQIELACQMVYSYLSGTYHAGEAFTDNRKNSHEEPEDIIRKNAPGLQQELKDVWNLVKERKYKWTEQEMILSDGFKLKDLLHEDFKEDIAMLSVISFFYGLIFLGILAAIGHAINPAIGTIVSIVFLLHVIACVLGFAPLSRFWLPASVSGVMLRFINFGLGIYNWAEDQAQNSSKNWVILLIRIPVLFAKLIKYLILLPLTELAKVFVGNKIVGVVKQKVNYYADAAEWYIEQLMNEHPDDMSPEELFHLSYIHSELWNVKAKTWEPDNSATATDFTTGKSPQDNDTDTVGANRGQNYSSAQSTKHEDKPEPYTPPFEEMPQKQPEASTEEIKPIPVDIPEPGTNETEDAVLFTGFEPIPQKQEAYLEYTKTETHPPDNKKKKRIAWAAAFIILASGVGAYLLYNTWFKPVKGSTVIGKNISKDTTATAVKTENNTQILQADTQQQATQPEPVTQIAVKTTVLPLSEKTKMTDDINTATVSEVNSGNTQLHNGFVFLSKAQILGNLLNKPLCEGITYTGSGQKVIFTNAFPGKEYQMTLGLYGTIRINIILEDELTNKSCGVEVIYKKDKGGFELENYAQK